MQLFTFKPTLTKNKIDDTSYQKILTKIYSMIYTWTSSDGITYLAFDNLDLWGIKNILLEKYIDNGIIF